MAAIIENQPVAFLPENADSCACEAVYNQLANIGDPISFQIGNPCTYNIKDPLLTNSIFNSCDLTDWSESDLNGYTGTWNATGCTGAVSTQNTKILWQNFGNAMIIDQLYYIFLDIAFGGTGCVAYIVASTDDFATQYDILYTITDSDSYELSYLATKEYTSIGEFIVGTCELSNTVSLFQLYDQTINECVEFCVKDANGVEIVDSTDFANNSQIDYFYNYINVTTSWSSLGVDAGCPNVKICVCNDILDADAFYYGENLITIGTNGTFEGDSDGLVDYAAAAITRDINYVWRGMFSGLTTNNNAAASGILITNDVNNRIRLKPNTQYLLAAKVMFRQDPDTWGANPTGTIEAVIGGANVSLISSVTMVVPTVVNVWKTVSAIFETDASYEQIAAYSFWHIGFPTALDFNIYFDDIILMEYDDTVRCSQLFNIQVEHPCTLNLQWWNEKNAFGFGYESVILINYYKTHFFQSLRVAAKLRSPKYPSERVIYKDSKGERQMVYADREKTIELVIEDQPEYIHNAIAVALSHDTFTVDGVEYVSVEEAYQPANRKSSVLASVIVELTKKVQNLINRK